MGIVIEEDTQYQTEGSICIHTYVYAGKCVHLHIGKHIYALKSHTETHAEQLYNLHIHYIIKDFCIQSSVLSLV